MPKKTNQTPMSEELTANGGAASVDRALLVLSAFKVSDRSLSLADIAERTTLYKSTILRLLASLEHAGLVQRNADNQYTLGPAIARLYKIYSASFSLEAAVMPIMKELVALTRESATFHVRQGDHRLCLFRVDSPQPIRDHINPGDLLPLDRGAGGRTLMAFSGADGTLYEQIRKERIISLIDDRSEGVAGISAPVFGAADKLVGAITLTMPSSRFDKNYESAVRKAAADMTLAVGGSLDNA